MIDPVVAWDKLSNFETAQEIREYFQRENIQALRSEATFCPIARWLKSTTGETDVCVSSHIEMGEMQIQMDNSRYPLPKIAHEYTFQHTLATSTFMDNFDRGFYPELELPECYGPHLNPYSQLPINYETDVCDCYNTYREDFIG